MRQIAKEKGGYRVYEVLFALQKIKGGRLSGVRRESKRTSVWLKWKSEVGEINIMFF